MSRGKQSFIEDVIEVTSKLPWWAGVLLAIAAYLGLHGVATSEIMALAQPGKLGAFVGQSVFKMLATYGQYLLPLIFLLGAAISAYSRLRHRLSQGPVTASPDHSAFNPMSWQQFEAVVCEGFRRQGYSVAQKSGKNAAGGLVLKKQGETYLVQCEQWRAVRVGVNIVRELHGAMAKRGAIGGFVVTSGVFTKEARAYARSRHIELMDGKALKALTAGIKVMPRFFRDPLSVMTTGSPFCPECQSRMVKRRVQRGTHAGRAFWRCLRHPDCKGKRPA